MDKTNLQLFATICTAVLVALCYIPLCLKVKPSPMLSSGLLFALVQQCPLMKSLDMWTSTIGRSEISLVISREQETSMSQSMNDQPFTNHFKMRTFRNYFMLNCLATLTYTMISSWSHGGRCNTNIHPMQAAKFARFSALHLIAVQVSYSVSISVFNGLAGYSCVNP